MCEVFVVCVLIGEVGVVFRDGRDYKEKVIWDCGGCVIEIEWWVVEECL